MDDPFAGSGPEAPPPYLGGTQPPGISERMQALMSRAEQEVAEQRQLQSLVGEVRQSLQQLQEEMRQAAGAHTLEIVRGEVTGIGAEVRSSTTMIGERLEAVVRAVGASAQVMQGVGQQLERITELLNNQHQQIAGLTASVAQQRDVLGALPETVASRAAAPSEAVREQVSGIGERVDGAVGGMRDEMTALSARVDRVVDGLRERLDGVVAEVRADSAESARALAERVDAAVLALAEALLRPRGGAAPEAAPEPAEAEPAAAEPAAETNAPPWAGAATASGDDSPSVEEIPDGVEVADTAPAEDAPWSDAAADPDTVDAAVEAAEDEDEDEDEDTAAPAEEGEVAEADEESDEDDDEPDEVDEDDQEDDEDEDDDQEDDEDEDEDEAEEPAAAFTVPAVEPLPSETSPAETNDLPEPGEVPLDAWPDATENEGDGETAAPPPPEDSGWGWDSVREFEQTADEPKEKRRPWWRPGG